jgi:fibronectin type 3 domain-containing protein
VHRALRAGAGPGLALTLAGLLLLGCEEVVVEPVTVRTVEVVPGDTSLSVDESFQFAVRLFDSDGAELSGRTIVWSCEDTTIAAVDELGMVVGRRSGSTRVHATVDGADGTATVTVRSPPSIVLDPTSASFVAPAGATAVSDQDVQVRNGGEEPLEGLTAVVETAGVTWLTATLTDDRAPATLTLSVRTDGLAPGDYAATVRVAAPDATNSPVRIPVSFEVQPGPPAAPTSLSATTVAGPAIDLAWTDNSDDEVAFAIERRIGSGSYAALTEVDADVTSYRDTGLTTDRAYAYRVRACGPGACSAFSNEAETATPPTAPSALTIGTVTSSSVQLGWTDNSATETGFEVERSRAGGPFARVAIAGPDNTTFTDTGLDPGTVYTYRVRACNDGGCSDYAGDTDAETLPPPAPAAPSGLSATAVSSTAIRLEWTDNSSDETRFEIQRRQGSASFVAVANVGESVTAYTDNGLEPATAYDYRIRACHDSGCSAYTGASATTDDPPPPAPPSALSATATSRDRIAVTWSDNSDDEISFVLQRRGPGGDDFSLLAELEPDTESYEDRISGEGTYTYRIQACGTHACSDFSAEASALSFPEKPADLKAEAASATEIQLTWEDRSDIEGGFEIERKPPGGSFSRIAAVEQDTRSFRDGGLLPETKYEYRVRACNVSGCSDYSNKASATTDPPPPTAPDAPTDLRAVSVTPGAVELRWSDNSDNEAEFRIERLSFLLFVEIGRVGEDVEEFIDTSVIQERTYEYRIIACNHQGCSAPSNTIEVTTPEDDD